jgi:sialate O-acetylesterase
VNTLLFNGEIKMKYKSIYTTLIICLFVFQTGNGQVKLPRLVRDSMILQRDATLKIWGWASKNEKIAIRFNGRSYKTRADANGNWFVSLSPMKAGGPYTMDIAAANKISLKDILIGDVWICSGQSNMVHQMNIHDVTYAKDIAEANNEQIRHFWMYDTFLQSLIFLPKRSMKNIMFRSV